MPAVPFKVKAVFEYRSEEPDDLNFDNGQVITVTDDEDADWYTGEYTSAAGEKLEGLFPRNFVEKYEPAIPSRPQRTPKRPTAPEPPPEPAPVAEDPAVEQAPEPVNEAEIEAPKEISEPPTPSPPPVAAHEAAPPAPSTASAASKPAKAAPPPVAEKPTSSSFKDRIAAFNKPAAAPIAPFKPAAQGNTSSSFIKKPFVAPPPSKNSYVPTPREPPPQKVYRRAEDASLQREEQPKEPTEPPRPVTTEEPASEDQPKPTSLKERIALLQKQQLEQQARHAESAQKKEKPKKPPKKRAEPAEEPEAPATEQILERLDTNETVGRKSDELSEDVEEAVRPQPQRQMSSQSAASVPQPSRELVSDTNDADDSGAADTEDALETSTEEERPRSKGRPAVGGLQPGTGKHEQLAEQEAGEEGEEEDTEEEEEDPEVRRRRELRDRMAKMSGGMGMMGMFGPPGGMGSAPRKTRPSAGDSGNRVSDQQSPEEAVRAPPVPIMALPGMSNQMQKRKDEPAPVEEDSDHDDTAHPTPLEGPQEAETGEDYISQPPKRASTGRSLGSASSERAVPPLPPQRDARAPPPPPPEARPVPPPPQSPTSRAVPAPPEMTSLEEPSTVEAHESEEEDEAVVVGQPRVRQSEEQPTSPTSAPPVPKNRPTVGPPTMSSPVTSPSSRPPPPPPPGHPSTKHSLDSTGDFPSRQEGANESEEEVTEYDGDYDTDIASSAKHKDALKSYDRGSSIDDDVLTDDAGAKSPSSPPSRTVPPLPPMPSQREPPPPPPSQNQAKSRKSMDAPRAAPPPVPPPAQQPMDEEEYDPFRYSAPQHGLPTPPAKTSYQPMLQSPQEEMEEPDMYGGISPQPPRVPPHPPNERSLPPPPTPPAAEPPRKSLDVKRTGTMSRRSMEQPRPSSEHGFIAQDIDLGESSLWWTQQNLLPPSLQGRPDILREMEQSSNSKRGGRTTISKDVYVLYQDYSQTNIRASWDSSDPAHATLEQSHERPPQPPRKDQLEAASDSLGAHISAAATSAGTSGSTVADGSAHGFVFELIRSLPAALPPVGTRSFGALVYANLANASTQQHDEIRPGDIVTFRHAKFAGHKGGLHQKYTMEVGKPDHVGVVIDWDGTKKKIRAWQQTGGTEEKGKRAKVREESYRVGDLKSGEVRVWRVMPRSFVGWDKS